MNRKKSYRILLSGCLAAVLLLLVFYVVREADDALPDHINLVQGKSESFESSVPVRLETESDALECSAVNETGTGTGQIHTTSVSISAAEKGYYKVEAKLFGLFPLKSIYVNVMEETVSVIPGGQAVGIYMETNGLLVLGTGTIIGEDGNAYEPAASFVQSGDYIMKLNDVALSSKRQLAEEVQKVEEGTALLTLRRDGKEMELNVPVMRAEDGTNKLGIWIRDDTQGIGTVTYVDREGKFGALGHPITDVDTGTMMELQTGELYPLSMVTIRRGTKGDPGELSGIIRRSPENRMGEIYMNSSKGIYGKMEETEEDFEEKSYPVGWKQEIETGYATILSGVSGEVKEYAIEIEKIVLNPQNSNKGLEIHVTDEKLLNLTGGIVQGMSGSPILQNGKIVGAVTHVFVQDSTRGYGIFIENMVSY